MPRVKAGSKRSGPDRGKSAQRRLRLRALVRSVRFLAMFAAFLCMAALAMWSATSGWAEDRTRDLQDRFWQTLADAGFAVDQVLVFGRRRTDPELLRLVLGVENGQPIFNFDPTTALASVESISWVASATIERRLPDTVIVTLVERSPVAIWQHNRHFKLIDADGVVLTDRNLGLYDYLPVVVGPDAAAHAAEVLALVGNVPEFAERLEAAIRIGERRWDLQFDSGVTVKLPEANALAALHRVAELNRESDLLERDIRTIDARWDDRVIVEVTPAADTQLRRAEENT